jgi:hypothetical protein
MNKDKKQWWDAILHKNPVRIPTHYHGDTGSYSRLDKPIKLQD